MHASGDYDGVEALGVAVGEGRMETAVLEIESILREVLEERLEGDRILQPLVDKEHFLGGHGHACEKNQQDGSHGFAPVGEEDLRCSGIDQLRWVNMRIDGLGVVINGMPSQSP
jgi:hypothetical protein